MDPYHHFMVSWPCGSFIIFPRVQFNSVIQSVTYDRPFKVALGWKHYVLWKYFSLQRVCIPCDAETVSLRFKDVVVPCGGADIYLTRKYGDCASARGFATWISETFPDDPKIKYTDGFLSTGPCCVRPWQLGFRTEKGIAGYSEPEEASILLGLILSEGPLDLIASHNRCNDLKLPSIDKCIRMHEVANCPHRRFSEWLTFGHVRFRTDSERLAGVERLAIFAHVDSAMMLGDSRETDPPLPSCAYLRFLPISYCQFRWFDSCKLLSLTASVWTLQAQTQCLLSALASSRGGAEVWCCCVDWKGSAATTSRFKKSTLSSRIGFLSLTWTFIACSSLSFLATFDTSLFLFACIYTPGVSSSCLLLGAASE